MVTTSSVTFKKALFDINSFKKRGGKRRTPSQRPTIQKNKYNNRR
jgi:hypothetical protein